MRLKLLRIAVFILSIAPFAAAQFTTVTGTVTDPNGLLYVNGTIVATLVTTATPIFTATNTPYSPPSGPSGLSSAGSFVIRLADNTTLTPAATKWQFKVCSSSGTIQPAGGNGPVCFQLASPITISGSSQDISTQLDAVALALSAIVGGGTGTVTGTGTNNALPKWSNGPGGVLGNSGLSDNGTSLTTAENIQMIGTGFGVSGFSSPLVCPFTAGYASGSANCQGVTGQVNPPASSANNTIITGVWGFDNPTTNLSNAPLMTGVLGSGVLAADGSPAEFAGVLGITQTQGTGTIAQVSGVFGLGGVGNGNATAGQNGTIDEGVGGQTEIFAAAQTAPLTAAFYAHSPILTGTSSHNYGLFIADQAVGGANNPDPWAIFTNGSAKSQLGGALTVLGTLTTGITGGGTQCTQVSNVGILTGTGTPCGTGSGTITGVTAGNGLSGGGSSGSITVTAATGTIDASKGYVSGDPCATIAANLTTAVATSPQSIDLDFSNFANSFPNGIVPCQSNPFENQVFSGTVRLGPIQIVKSVPWVTPGNNQRVTIFGNGTSDPGVAIASENSTITDCDSDAPGWNGTACVINGVTVAAFPSTGHCIAFTYPHGSFGAATYCPSLWLGGMGPSGVIFGGSFGAVIKDFNIQSGNGGGNFGVYSTGVQEQSYCDNVVVRASNNSAFFFDKAQGNGSGPGHWKMTGCTGRAGLNAAQAAAQGYPNAANQIGMGYGIWAEGNGIVIWASGGGCTTYPQAYPTTATGTVSAAKLTYGGAGCTSTPTCTVSSNHGGSGATCTWGTESGGSVPSVSVSGGSGYSLGDAQTGAPFEIADATINGKNTSNMQEAIVMEGVFSPSIHSIHTGFDAGWGIHIGYGSGVVIGGVFENNDLENTSNGVYHFGVGIDNAQIVFATGRGGSVASIQDDSNNFTSGTSVPCSLYEPGTLNTCNTGGVLVATNTSTASIVSTDNAIAGQVADIHDFDVNGTVEVGIGASGAISAVSESLTTPATSAIVPFSVSEGTGPAATNAPLAVSVTGGVGGANAGATSPGLKGGGETHTTGAGSNAGATSGTGGAGGDYTITTASGGTAAVGSTTGKGGDLLINLGAAGGTGTAGAPGQVSIVGSQVGAALTTPLLNLTQTWNTTGAVNGIFESITDTAEATGSAPLNIQLGGVNFFKLATQAGVAHTFGPNITLGGTKPTVTLPGVTPYLNIQALVKGTANTCTFALTTGTFTLALSPVSLCAYTLPATAVTWYWTCTMGWSNPAGTTPTFAEGVTWAQAPSAAFQMADIFITNGNGVAAGINDQLTTSTTTNTTILATPSLTTSATIFRATMSGTFTGSATSGVFSPTVSLTGTGATGTAVGGCTIQ